MPEKQNVEWKAIWKDEYLQWICGFANAQGGTLYIGKDDNGNPIGLNNAKKLLEDLPNVGSEKCNFRYQADNSRHCAAAVWLHYCITHPDIFLLLHPRQKLF